MGAASNFQLKAFFLDGELVEFSAFHQFDDLLDLFYVQRGCLVEVEVVCWALVPDYDQAFKKNSRKRCNARFKPKIGLKPK